MTLTGTSNYSVSGGTTGAIIASTTVATAGTLAVAGTTTQTITSAGAPVTYDAALLTGGTATLSGNAAYTVTNLGALTGATVTEGATHTSGTLGITTSGTFAVTVNESALGTTAAGAGGAVSITAGGTGALTVATTVAHASTTITAVAEGKTVTVTGAGPTSITTSTAGVHTIVGGTGADTITGGTGVDVITPGQGGDSIILGSTSGADRIVIAPTTDTGLIAGFVTGTAPVNGSIIGTSALDKITNFQAGVSLDLGLVFTTPFFTRNGSALNADRQAIILGDYVASTNTFTISTSGTSTLVAYDDDLAAGAGTNYRGIILVGYVDGAANDTANNANGFTGLTGVA